MAMTALVSDGNARNRPMSYGGLVAPTDLGGDAVVTGNTRLRRLFSATLPPDSFSAGTRGLHAITRASANAILRANVLSVANVGDEVPQPMPKHLSAVLEELSSYHMLEDGWDGPGSVAPSVERLAAAKHFLLALPPTAKPPEPMVSADGGVGWFWNDDEIYLSIEFFSDDRYRYFGQRDNADYLDSRFFDGRSVPDEIISIIS